MESPERQSNGRMSDESVETIASMAAKAITALYSAPAGSQQQADANAWLVELDSNHKALFVGVTLLQRRLQSDPQESAGNADQVVFFAAQVLLSRIRQNWRLYSWDDRECAFRIVLQFVTQQCSGAFDKSGAVSDPETGTPNGKISPLTFSRLLLVLAAICVRALHKRPDMLKAVIGILPAPQNLFQLLKLIVEELEQHWSCMAHQERLAAATIALGVRDLVLESLHRVAMRELAGNSAPGETVLAALQCLQAWIGCSIMCQQDSMSLSCGDENLTISENCLINLGVSFEYLVRKSLHSDKEHSSASLADWVCHYFRTSDPESSIFQSATDILIDALSLQTFVVFDQTGWFSNPEQKSEYRAGLESVSYTVLLLAKEIGGKGTSIPIKRNCLDLGPSVLRWRAVCSVASVICSQHLSGLMLFCSPENQHLIQILLRGVASPMDISSLEFCLDFWDIAGDALASCERFLESWNRKQHNNAQGMQVLSVPHVLSSLGARELFCQLLDALVSSLAACLMREGEIYEGTSESRIRNRVCDSITDLCRSWPGFDGSEDVSQENSSWRFLVLSLHNRFKLRLQIELSDENVAHIRAIVLLLAVTAAELRDDDEEEEEEEEEEEQEEEEGEEEELRLPSPHVQLEEQQVGCNGGSHAGEGNLQEKENKSFGDSLSLNNFTRRTQRSVSTSVLTGISAPPHIASAAAAAPANNASDKIPLSASALWCGIAADILSATWATRIEVIRGTICSLIGELDSALLFQINSERNLSFVSEPVHLLSRCIGFLLSSLGLQQGAAQLAPPQAATALHRLCHRLAPNRRLLHLFQGKLPIPVVALDASIVGQEKVVAGFDGILTYYETYCPGLAPRTKGIVLECLTTLAVRIVAAKDTGMNEMEAAKALEEFLERLAFGKVVQAVAHAQINNGESRKQAVLNPISDCAITLAYALLGLEACGPRRSAQRIVARALLTCLGRSTWWLDFQALVVQLVCAGHGESVLQPLCECMIHMARALGGGYGTSQSELTSQNDPGLTNAAHALAASTGHAVLTCFSVTFEPVCLRVLYEIMPLSLRSDALAAIAGSAQVLLNPDVSQQVEFLGARFRVTVRPQMLDPEVTKWFFLLCRQDVRFNANELGAYLLLGSDISLLELCLVGAQTCLSENVGGRQGSAAVSSFLSSAAVASASQDSGATARCVLEQCHTTLVDGCVGYLASSTLGHHNVRSDVIETLLCCANSATLVRVLSQEKYQHLPSRTKEAVCHSLLRQNHNGRPRRVTSSQSRACANDVSLLLSGYMQPLPDFDYSLIGDGNNLKTKADDHTHFSDETVNIF